MDTSTIIVIILVVIILLFIFCSFTKKRIASKEPYTGMFNTNQIVTRPNHRPPQFDNTRGSSNQQISGSPQTPVANLIENYDAIPSYAMMGGNDPAYADPRLPSGGVTSNQVNEILAQKFGRGSQPYTDTAALLPTPDMRRAFAMDPTNPSTFMYDRSLFAPLKRTLSKGGVDFIRGDLAIQPIRTGWFDSRGISSTDLVKGYFQNYLDIEQSTALKDIVYERTPTSEENNNPWGSLASRTVYSFL